MAKHFMIFYGRGTGTYIVTEPRPWARENANFFPNFDFVNNHPTTDIIEDFLIENFNFQRMPFNQSNIVVLQNLDPNLQFQP